MKRLLLILKVADTELLELAVGLGTATWGLWNSTPFVGAQVGLNVKLTSLAPLYVWSLAFLAVGLLTLFALDRNYVWLRRAAALCNMVVWLNLALASVTSGGAGALFFLTTAFGSLWSFWRLRGVAAWTPM